MESESSETAAWKAIYRDKFRALQWREKINACPQLQSLLYDLDLMPEQLKPKTQDWVRMQIIIQWFAAYADVPGVTS